VHDYQPEWDYSTIEIHEVACLNDFEKSRVLEIIADTKTQLAPALGFDDFDVFFVEHMGLAGNGHREDAVAIYCDGTSSRPVIGVDMELMQELCLETNGDVLTQFEVSLAHELAHAFQETLGLDHGHPNGFDEDDAERFARHWVDQREALLGVLQRENALSKSLKP